jgi:hypothetical protein
VLSAPSIGSVGGRAGGALIEDGRWTADDARQHGERALATNDAGSRPKNGPDRWEGAATGTVGSLGGEPKPPILSVRSRANKPWSRVGEHLVTIRSQGVRAVLRRNRPNNDNGPAAALRESHIGRYPSQDVALEEEIQLGGTSSASGMSRCPKSEGFVPIY